MHLDELYRAVWDNPDDDATKLVLADALLAIGDPRGELIQLQFSDRHDESGAMRLLQRHGLTWLGALRGKVIPLAYEKGFLVACQVVSAEGAGGHPEWSTVHSVQIEHEDLALLDDPVLRSLRAVIEAGPKVVALLVTLPVARRLALIGATHASSLGANHTALAALPLLVTAEAPRVRLSRAADGTLSHLTVRWWRAFHEMVDTMPPDAITTATISGVPRSQREIVQQQLVHFTSVAADIQHMAQDEDEFFELRNRQ